MQKVPTLSVIIPAYNVRTYIRQAVKSVLRQSFSDLELIIVDDGSTDGSMDALNDIDDKRLRRLHQDHLGIASALNKGISVAKGNYIGFLDGDDLWSETKADRHVSFMSKHPEKDLSFCHALLIDESGFAVRPIKSHGSGVLSFHDLLLGCPNGNAIVRREAIEKAGPFDADLMRSEDLDMWLRIAAQRNRNVYCLAEYLALYRRRPGQLTSDIDAMHKGWQQLIDKFTILAPNEIRKSKEQAYQARFIYYASLAYEQKRYAEAFAFLQKSMNYAPWHGLFKCQMWLLAGIILSASLLPEQVYQFLRRGVNRWRSRFGGWNRSALRICDYE